MKPLPPVVFIALALATAFPVRGARTGAPGPEPAEPTAASPSPIAVETPPKIEWMESVEEGLALAGAQYRPVFVFFSTSHCPLCDVMKSKVLNDLGVTRALSQYLAVRIDPEKQPSVASRFGVIGVPHSAIVASDGVAQWQHSGFLEAYRLEEFLQQGLQMAAGQRSPEHAAWVDLIKAGSLTPAHWPELMLALGSPAMGGELRQGLLAMRPFPRQELVALLENRLLAVRLGALDLLESYSGETHGYDAWRQDPAANAEALAHWRAWAGGKDDAAPPVNLSADELLGLIQDYVSENLDRSARARRILTRGGPRMLESITQFQAANPVIPEKASRKLRELRYSLQMPAAGGLEPQRAAADLVFGNLDARLKALIALKGTGSPILHDFINDPDPLVRETAIDSLMAAGRSVLPMLAAHLDAERDPNVIHTILRGLGDFKSKKALEVVARYASSENEDLAVAAIGSLAKLKSNAAEDSIGKALGDPRWRVRAAALEAAAELRMSPHGAKIMKMLDDPDEFVRFSAVSALASIESGSAIPKLISLFAKDDKLKGPIAAAFASLKAPIPPAIAASLDSKPPDVILAVLHGLDDAREPSHLGLIARFANHQNLDVSCTSLRILAGQAASQETYQQVLAKKLRAGRPEEKLTIYHSIAFEAAQMRPYSYARPPANRPPPSGPKPETTSTDALEAFRAARGSQGPSSDPMAEILRASEENMRSGKSDEVQFAAAAFLLKFGHPGAASHLRSKLAEHPAGERSQVASHLRFANSEETTLPLAIDLLRDSQAEVRAMAAESLLDARSLLPASTDAVFGELVRPDTKLQISDIFSYELADLADHATGRGPIGKWARHILEDPDSPAERQALALVLLQSAWTHPDRELIAPFLTSENVWLRRAALHTLGRNDEAAFRALAATAAEDPSEHVRVVVPVVYAHDRAQWTHFFDAKTFERDWRYWSGTRKMPLPEAVRPILERLTQDPSPQVRLEAYFSLASRRLPVDAAAFHAAVQAMPDREAVSRRVGSWLIENYRSLGPDFAVFVPYLTESHQADSSATQVRAHFNIHDADGEEEDARPALGEIPKAQALLASARGAHPSMSPPHPAPAANPNLRVVYFSSPGCPDCRQVKGYLEELQSAFPELQIEEHSIRQAESIRLNEALSERFNVPSASRRVAPAVFAGGGYLVKNDIAIDKLGRLISDSAAVPIESWHQLSGEQLAAANASLAQSFSSFNLGAVILGGLVDGINPCAFATIIFFLSYLQVARRAPGEILGVGLAFTLGVFITYFSLGLGLSEVVHGLQSVQVLAILVNWVMVAALAVLIALTVRDGVLASQGRLREMTLQLPGFLKERVHSTIRTSTRHSRFLLAAFLAGAIVSALELACTGQIYLPTIIFMVQASADRVTALGYLVAYNLAFILPLLIICFLAWFGMRHHSLVEFQQRHTAAVKFATAALFAALLLFLIFSGRLW